MIAFRALSPLLLALLIAACGETQEATSIEDPSKLSAELEERAQEIEQRAAIAVREAETLAEQDLHDLRAEAAAAQPEGPAMPTDEAEK